MLAQWIPNVFIPLYCVVGLILNGYTVTTDLFIYYPSIYTLSPVVMKLKHVFRDFGKGMKNQNEQALCLFLPQLEAVCFLQNEAADMVNRQSQIMHICKM